MPGDFQTISSIGERKFLSELFPKLPARGDVIVGPGDDCAVVRFSDSEDLVLKEDPTIEGRHFVKGTNLRQVGHKAIARVLSDFAAMGAEPRHALVGLVAPKDLSLSDLENLREGLCATARDFGVAIVGGDTTEGAELQLHVFCAGTVPHSRALLRSGARPGDVLWTTGPFGRSFESGHHLEFLPRLAESAVLRDGGATSCIDVSDGLATEAWHLAESSGVSIVLDPDAIPFTATCAAMPDPLAHALSDGEDFELLFTAPPDAPAVAGGRFCAIGKVEKSVEHGRVLFPDGKIVPDSGFDHFLSAQKGECP